MRITITRATVDDLPWVRHLMSAFMAEPVQAAGYPHFDAEELDAFTVAAYQNLARNSRFGVWLAWRGKHAIGTLGGEVQERLVGKPRVYANALWAYVVPAQRESDTGFRLLEAFGTWAQTLGVETMECRAVSGDTRYADHGYPLVATCYAAPIAQVITNWRRHARPEAPKANGHDMTAEVSA